MRRREDVVVGGVTSVTLAYRVRNPAIRAVSVSRSVDAADSRSREIAGEIEFAARAASGSSASANSNTNASRFMMELLRKSDVEVVGLLRTLKMCSRVAGPCSAIPPATRRYGSTTSERRCDRTQTVGIVESHVHAVRRTRERRCRDDESVHERRRVDHIVVRSRPRVAALRPVHKVRHGGA